MNTLTFNSTTITLPYFLHWEDEFDFTPGVLGIEYSLTGALIVEQATKQSGRPITLTTPDGGDWISRQSLVLLYNSLATITPITLTLHGNRTFSVVWRHNDNPIEAKLIVPGLIEPRDSTQYFIVLRFIAV